MTSQVDRLFLTRAVELAERGLYGVSGNPRVGCVIVRDGQVLGRGWHQRAGGPHAEVNAIADAGGDVRGATVYVSLEPCCHTGRQPPCVEVLIRHRVARVVVALVDPDPRVAGNGCRALREAGVSVDVDELPAARALNQGYLRRTRHGLPLVRLKIAASLDGRSAMANGESQWITSPEARADAQHWRARCGAIITGIGTVLTDDPALTVRGTRFGRYGAVRQPHVAIADRHVRTPVDAKLFDAERRVFIFRGASAPSAAHPKAEVTRCEDLRQMLERLAAADCDEVLVESGATLTGAFLRAELWDEAVIYLAPKLLGASAKPMARFRAERLADALQGRLLAVDGVGSDARVLLRRAVSS